MRTKRQVLVPKALPDRGYFVGLTGINIDCVLAGTAAGPGHARFRDGGVGVIHWNSVAIRYGRCGALRAAHFHRSITMPLASNWWTLTIRGIVAILFGIFT